MTDFRALCEELAEALDECQRLCGDQPESPLVWKSRAALAEQPVGQSRRCIYNPVQIAECGGPCEQIGPEACDCGALWVSQDAEQPVGPTDEELDELKENLWDRYKTLGFQGEEFMYELSFGFALDDFARAANARWGQP